MKTNLKMANDQLNDEVRVREELNSEVIAVADMEVELEKEKLMEAQAVMEKDRSIEMEKGKEQGREKIAVLATAPAAKEKVLLIDDDRVFGKIIQNTAVQFGMSVDTLKDAPSKWRLGSLENYDLLLLDYDLESTTGFAFAEVLNKAMPYMPIILISSSDRPTADKLFELPNIIGFVSKWSKPEDFFLKSLELYRNMPVLVPHVAVA